MPSVRTDGGQNQIGPESISQTNIKIRKSGDLWVSRKSISIYFSKILLQAPGRVRKAESNMVLLYREYHVSIRYYYYDQRKPIIIVVRAKN